MDRSSQNVPSSENKQALKLQNISPQQIVGDFFYKMDFTIINDFNCEYVNNFLLIN